MKLKFSKQLGNVSIKISAFVVGVVLLFFIINSIISIGIAYDNAVTETYKTIDAAMESSLKELDCRFETVEATTNAMALNVEQVAADTSFFRDFLKKVLNATKDISAVTIECAPYYFSKNKFECAPTLFVETVTGDTIYNDATDLGLHYIDPKYKDSNWFEGIKGKCVWSKPYVSVSDSIMRVSYSAPMYDRNGNIFAVLCSTVTLDWIKENFEKTRPSDDCELCVINKDGDYVYNISSETGHKNALEDAKSIGNEDLVKIISSMMKGERGSKTISSPVEKYLKYIPIERTNWSVYFSYPLKLIKSKPRELAISMSYRGLLTFLLLFLIITIGIYAIIRPFTDNLKKVTESNAAMNHDLTLAADIQQSMLPHDIDKNFCCKQIEVSGMLRPAKMVGGDLYGYFYKNGYLYFCVGDISGKGVPAAMYMVIIRILLHEISNTEKYVDRIIAKLNQTMTHSDNSMFCTLFLGSIDLATGKLSCCNAGHNPPILIKHSENDTQADYLRVTPSAAVGVFEDEEYFAEEYQLEENDELFLYTDGVTESEDINHKLLGENATLDAVKRISNVSKTTETFIRDMLNAVDLHARDAVQSDDITMLMMRYSPKDSLLLTNDTSQTALLGDWVEIMCKRHGISCERLFNIQLAIEEAVVNVMCYSYPGKTNMPIYLNVKEEGENVNFIVEDEGSQYNPLKTEAPDFEKPIEECKIGGLGVFLYTELLDKVEYKYENNRNVLTMIINKNKQ